MSGTLDRLEALADGAEWHEDGEWGPFPAAEVLLLVAVARAAERVCEHHDRLYPEIDALADALAALDRPGAGNP